MNTPAHEQLTDNPLDALISARLGIIGTRYTRADLVEYQIARLADTIAWAKQRSPFYRHRLAGVNERTLTSMDALRRIPFTSADDLRRSDPPLLCVSQSEISRVVTLDTSGTSGPAKRLFFTPDDQEATIDFFRCGMSVFTRPGDRVAILFPGERPGSVGDLLAEGLRRLGAMPVLVGWPQEPAATAARLQREQPDVVAGAPVAVLAVARSGAPLRPRGCQPAFRTGRAVGLRGVRALRHDRDGPGRWRRLRRALGLPCARERTAGGGRASRKRRAGCAR
jgi:phenylacetate-coenzyme A ligase PaaK-like adenylate-forming protein